VVRDAFYYISNMDQREDFKQRLEVGALLGVA
jgi:hypothetical protein